VSVFEDESGCFALVLVGALFVGSMSTVWHGDVEPLRRDGSTALDVPGGPAGVLDRGAEMGRFNMGSTVILLLPPGAGRWASGLQPGQTLRLGDNLGTRAP
jgi:phosphatidylserine decarboxylase